MVPLAGLSRRAFVVASALAATAPTVVAARRRKPAPQAFLAIAVQGVSGDASGLFKWSYQEQVGYLATSFTANMSGATPCIAVTASPEQTHQEIVSAARSQAQGFLQHAGHVVPEDRIAVIML